MVCAVTQELHAHLAEQAEAEAKEQRETDVEVALLADKEKWKAFVMSLVRGMNPEHVIEQYAEMIALRYAAESAAARDAWDAEIEWTAWCSDDSEAMESPIADYVRATIKDEDEANAQAEADARESDPEDFGVDY